MTLMVYRYPYLIPVSTHMDIHELPRLIGDISMPHPHYLTPNINRHFNASI